MNEQSDSAHIARDRDLRSKNREISNPAYRGYSEERRALIRQRSHEAYLRIKADPVAYAAHLKSARERKRAQYHRDPAYREKVKMAARGYTKDHPATGAHPRDFVRLYGMERQDLEFLMEAQESACAVCRRPISLDTHRGASVDHDHATGEVRALLCDPCNRAIGLLGDDLDRVQAAATYLRRHAHRLHLIKEAM